jgi:hypothetical protein
MAQSKEKRFDRVRWIFPAVSNREEDIIDFPQSTVMVGILVKGGPSIGVSGVQVSGEFIEAPSGWRWVVQTFDCGHRSPIPFRNNAHGHFLS